MRKKVIAFAAVVVTVAAMATVLTAFAFNPAAQTDVPEQAAPVAVAVPAELPVEQTAFTAPYGRQNQSDSFDVFSLMFDKDGQPVSKGVLEANLDKAIEDGHIDAEDKAVLMEMYDYCISGGGRAEMPCGPGGAGFGGCPFSR